MLPLGLLPPETVQAWQSAEPDSAADFAGGDFAGDCRRYAAYWKLARELLDNLPAKPARDNEQTRAAETIHARARAAAERFLAQHGAAVYQTLTQNYSRFLRVETLVEAAADAFPGLVPGAD